LEFTFATEGNHRVFKHAILVHDGPVDIFAAAMNVPSSPAFNGISPIHIEG
jgi:hypothetical protein